MEITKPEDIGSLVVAFSADTKIKIGENIFLDVVLDKRKGRSGFRKRIKITAPKSIRIDRIGKENLSKDTLTK